MSISLHFNSCGVKLLLNCNRDTRHFTDNNDPKIIS